MLLCVIEVSTTPTSRLQQYSKHPKQQLLNYDTSSPRENEKREREKAATENENEDSRFYIISFRALAPACER